MNQKIVRYKREDIPSMTPEEVAALKAKLDDPNFVIDTSDIPEWTGADFNNAIRSHFYRPIKKQATIRFGVDMPQ